MDLPTAHGPPPARGRIRSVPEDFVVDEVLGFEPDGAGTHLLLAVEKRGANTAWVAGQIARAAGVAVRDVGFAGHKDRHALTRQWLSVPWPGDAPLEPLATLAGDGFRVLSVHRHGRKLRPGSHHANQFHLRVRDVTGDPVALESRLASIGARGVPNYFGPQRFGRDGSNLRRAREWSMGGRAPRDRTERTFALSAARSHLFNEVLAARVQRDDWRRPLPGEAVILDGKRSFFAAPEVDDALLVRAATLDVHPSGPLPGRGASPATGEALAVEGRALLSEPALTDLLRAQGLEHERRSLRLPVRDCAWTFEEDRLSLGFALARGAFATAVLHELLADAWDAGEGGED